MLRLARVLGRNVGFLALNGAVKSGCELAKLVLAANEVRVMGTWLG